MGQTDSINGGWVGVRGAESKTHCHHHAEVQTMTKIISFSLLSGIAPDTFEHVTVTPLLTKAGLDVIESKMQTGL